MMTEDRPDHPTRRGLIPTAATGGLAISAGPAAAQRCPEIPAPRIKGPAVWLDLDQKDLDDAYDQSVYAFNDRSISERIAARTKTALEMLGPPERVAYGPAEIEKVDIFRTNRANAPVMIFIHGGAWRS